MLRISDVRHQRAIAPFRILLGHPMDISLPLGTDFWWTTRGRHNGGAMYWVLKMTDCFAGVDAS